jgi:hypothetical protein
MTCMKKISKELMIIHRKISSWDSTVETQQQRNYLSAK